jgi:CRP-like cAMP-binding protein
MDSVTSVSSLGSHGESADNVGELNSAVGPGASSEATEQVANIATSDALGPPKDRKNDEGRSSLQIPGGAVSLKKFDIGKTGSSIMGKTGPSSIMGKTSINGGSGGATKFLSNNSGKIFSHKMKSTGKVAQESTSPGGHFDDGSSVDNTSGREVPPACSFLHRQTFQVDTGSDKMSVHLEDYSDDDHRTHSDGSNGSRTVVNVNVQVNNNTHSVPPENSTQSAKGGGHLSAVEKARSPVLPTGVSAQNRRATVRRASIAGARRGSTASVASSRGSRGSMSVTRRGSVMMEQGAYGALTTDLPWYILVHEAPTNLARDFFVMCVVSINLCFWPVAAAWDIDEQGGFYLGIVIFSRVVFAADFILSFFTTVLNPKGVLLTDPKEIGKQNLQSGKMVVDVLALLSPSQFLVAKAMRMPELLDSLSLLCSHIFPDSIAAFIFQFLRLSMIYIECLHVFACGWYYIFLQESIRNGVLQPPSDGAKFDDPESLGDEYTIALQETIAMLLGAGSFTFPRQSHQRVYSSAVCTLGAVLQAWVFGQVAAVLSRVGEAESRYNQKMVSISMRMKQLNLPPELRTRVRNFYEMMWITSGSLNLDADDFVEGLSPPIRTSVKLNLFGDMVQRIPFLNKVSKITVEALVMQMKPQAYLTGDHVIQKGASDNWMGFIGEGELAIINPDHDLGGETNYVATRLPEAVVLRYLYRGDFFGEVALLFDVPRTCTIVACTFCQLHILTRMDFVQIEERYPDDWEIISEEFEKYREKKKYRASIKTQQKVRYLFTLAHIRPSYIPRRFGSCGSIAKKT